MGTGVFGGMIIATFVATVFVPLFFVFVERRKKQQAAEHRRASAGAAMKQALPHDGVAGANNTRARQLAARREQLIAVAEQLFLQHGFANTSVNADRSRGRRLARDAVRGVRQQGSAVRIRLERACCAILSGGTLSAETVARCGNRIARVGDAHAEADVVRRRPRGVSHRCT